LRLRETAWKPFQDENYLVANESLQPGSNAPSLAISSAFRPILTCFGYLDN